MSATASKSDIMENRLEKVEEKMNKLDKVADKMTQFMEFMMKGEEHERGEVELGEEVTEDVETEDVVTEQVVLEDSRDSVVTEVDDVQVEDLAGKRQDNLFSDRLDKYELKEKTSSAVDEDLAKFVNKTMTSHVVQEEFKKLNEAYTRPDNTPLLVAPRLNKEVWDLLPVAAQQRDLKAQNIQKNIVKGLFPLVQAMNQSKNNPEVLELLKDSFELLAHTSMEINNTRRSDLKPEMKNAKHLTHKEIPITTQLFGDDLESEMKKIEQTNKLRDNMSAPSFRRPVFSTGSPSFSRGSSTFRRPRTSGNVRFQPYKPFDNFQKKARAFLGSGAVSSSAKTRGNRGVQRGSYRGRR